MAKKIVEACSPAIWRKFNNSEKVLWQYFFTQFKFTIPISQPGRNPLDNSVLSDQVVAVISHNAACEVVWGLRDMLNEGAMAIAKKRGKK